jgi:hypothetical protein
MLTGLNHFLGNIVKLALVGMVGFGGYLVYDAYYANDIALRQRDEKLKAQALEIEQLGKDVAAKQQQIERLQIAMRLLKVDHRVAQVWVLDQHQPPGSDRIKTKFRFVEVDGDKAIDKPRDFTIDGDLLYVDALVIKFADEYVEQGDPLRSTSVCLFTRLFGEFQQPSDGYALDSVGSRPMAYGQEGTMSDFERTIWNNFWQYANDPELAKSAGIRALHGEAPSMKLEQGRLYEIELRASSGLAFVTAKDLPPAAATDAAL